MSLPPAAQCLQSEVKQEENAAPLLNQYLTNSLLHTDNVDIPQLAN